MNELYRDEKLRDELRGLLSEGELYLLCSQGGTVTYCAPDLQNMLERDMLGRTLHHFMREEQVAKVIAAAQNGRELELELKIDRIYFRCRMRPIRRKEFIIAFMPVGREEPAAHLPTAGLVQQEMRDGIQVILSALTQLKPSESEREQLCRAMILRQTLKLLRLADNVMDLTRYQSNASQMQLSDLDLRRLLQEVQTEAARVLDGIGAQLELELPELPCIIRGDRDKLLRILLNLICSTLQNMGQGPVTIQMKLSKAGDQYRIQYQDDTPARPEWEAAALGQRKDLSALDGEVRSAGQLDLELVRAFAALHGGSVMVSARSGGQPVYTVLLRGAQGKPGASLRSSAISYQDGADQYLKELSPALPIQRFIHK